MKLCLFATRAMKSEMTVEQAKADKSDPSYRSGVPVSTCLRHFAWFYDQIIPREADYRVANAFSDALLSEVIMHLMIHVCLAACL